MQETRVQFLGQEDPMEKEMVTHSSTLAWKRPWTERGYSPWGHKELGTTEWPHFTSLPISLQVSGPRGPEWSNRGTPAHALLKGNKMSRAENREKEIIRKKLSWEYGHQTNLGAMPLASEQKLITESQGPHYKKTVSFLFFMFTHLFKIRNLVDSLDFPFSLIFHIQSFTYTSHTNTQSINISKPLSSSGELLKTLIPLFSLLMCPSNNRQAILL